MDWVGHRMRGRGRRGKEGRETYIHKGVEEVAPDRTLGDICHLSLLGSHGDTYPTRRE
jgi:hypothetical protein